MPRTYVDTPVKEQILAIWPEASKFRAEIDWKIERDHNFEVVSKENDGIVCSFTVVFDSGDPPSKVSDLLTLSDLFGSEEVTFEVDEVFEGDRFAAATATLMFKIRHCTRGWH